MRRQGPYLRGVAAWELGTTWFQGSEPLGTLRVCLGAGQMRPRFRAWG